MSHTRREVLRGLGLAATAGVGATIPAAAQERGDFPHWDAQPDHVTLRYDENELLEYAPRLIFQQEARQKFQGLSGWTATSPDYDYDWHVLFADYTNQEGLLGPDSHLGDTEWYYVASNPETGETERVIYDAYHWLAGKLTTASITLDENHPVAAVVSPWHPYRHFDVDLEQAVAIDSVDDLTEGFDGMLENGLDQDLHPGTVTNPATMDIGGRTHWWKNTISGFSFDAWYATLLYDLGFAGADSVDPGALEV